MVNIEYANAYSEVLEILKYIPVEDYKKIPERKIELYKKNANKDYIFNYNPEKTLKEQNVSKIAKGIIAILFRDYWATDEQREKILAMQKNERINIEKIKRERYNPDNIFKSKNNNQNIVSNNIKNNIEIYSKNSLMKVENKKSNSIFRKIIDKIRNIIKKLQKIIEIVICVALIIVILYIMFILANKLMITTIK